MPTLGAYVSDEVYKKYDDIAKEKGLSRSKIVKQALDQAKFVDEKKILDLQIKKIKELEKIKAHISGISNNYNQITKYVNTHKSLDVKVLQTLKEIDDDLKDFQRWLDV